MRELGRLQLQKGMVDGALGTYRRLLEADPDDAEVAAEVERLEARKRELDAAAEQARLERAKDRFEEVRRLAEEFFRVRRFEEAPGAVDGYPEEFRDTA